MLAIIGHKISQTQKFLEDGTRIPVTEVLLAGGNVVIQTKTIEKDGYTAVQLGIGKKKKGNKALTGHVKGALLTEASAFLREVRLADGEEALAVGTVVKATEVLKPGDIVDVIGVSKGKGYAGGVKRHHFKGGPRTHGQSDRERAPGSIGQSTTPGRVYRGKRMAGRMGHERVTVQNLMVVGVTDDGVLIKGLIPGPVNNLIMIKKVGESKKFTPLYQEPKPASNRLSPQATAGGDEPEVIEETPVIEEVVIEAAEPVVEEISAEAAPVTEEVSKPAAEVAEVEEKKDPSADSTHSIDSLQASSLQASSGQREVVSSDAKAMEDKQNAS